MVVEEIVAVMEAGGSQCKGVKVSCIVGISGGGVNRSSSNDGASGGGGGDVVN